MIECPFTSATVRCGATAAARIDGKNRKIAFVTLAIGAEMLAGLRRIEMAARCHTRRWMAVRASAGTAVWVYVNMKAVLTRGQPRKLS